MQPTSPSRREFLKQGSGVLIGALVFSSGPIALLAPSKVWALELAALDEATGRALLRFARHLYPHDTMEDAVYAMVVKAPGQGGGRAGGEEASRRRSPRPRPRCRRRLDGEEPRSPAGRGQGARGNSV